MFRNTVTLFNYYGKTNKYYSTLLENAELQPKFRTRFTSSSAQDEDTSLLLIRYKKVLGEKVPFGSCKAYLAPKIWDRLFDEDKKNYFTFKPGEYDFFVKGIFTSDLGMNYETFKNSHDDVFLINGVKDFDSDLLHWEIEGY